MTQERDRFYKATGLKPYDNVEVIRFDNRTLTIGEGDKSVDVDNLSGWEIEGEIFFDPATDSIERYAEASDALVKECRMEL